MKDPAPPAGFLRFRARHDTADSVRMPADSPGPLANEEHAEYLEWIGGDFDPEDFDLNAINRVLGDYRSLYMTP